MLLIVPYLVAAIPRTEKSSAAAHGQPERSPHYSWYDGAADLWIAYAKTGNPIFPFNNLKSTRRCSTPQWT